jgi:hypothetical protein
MKTFVRVEPVPDDVELFPKKIIPWSSGPGPRLCVSGHGFDSHPGDQYVRTGNSQSLLDRVVG